MSEHGIRCSLSGGSNVSDKAAMETFFSSLKTERTANKSYRTGDAATGRRVRLYREVLQSPKTAFDTRISERGCLRRTDEISLTHCPRNRGQLKGRVRFLTRPCLSFAGQGAGHAALRAAEARPLASGFLKRAPSVGRRIFFTTASRAAKASEKAVIAISGRSTPWMSSAT